MEEALDNECPSSPPPNKSSTGPRGGKLARRARSFKEDFLDILSQMRSPGNQRSQSPHSPKSRTSMEGGKTNGDIATEDKNNPLRELERHVKEVQFALRHFRDVISKNKLEMLAGNGTVVLETVTNIVVLLRNCLVDEQSSALLSATSQLHQCVARLIRLCDDVVLYGNAALGRENVAQLVQAVLDAVDNLVTLARDKLSQKSANNNVHHIVDNGANHHHVLHMDNGRSSLPDIPLTPRQQQILQQTTPMPPPSVSPLPLSHSSECILQSRESQISPPPKPPLPARMSAEPPPLPTSSPQRSSAPPLPPKRRHRTTTAPNALSMSSISPPPTPAMSNNLGAGTTSDLASSVERLSVSPAHSAGGMGEDCNSLLSASNAGSLDSVLNTSNQDGDYDDDSMLWHRNGNISPFWGSPSRRESIDSPSFLSPSDLRLQDIAPTSLVSAGHTSRTLLNCEDTTDCRRQSIRTSSSSHVSQQSSSSTFSISSETGSFTSRSFSSSATKHIVEQSSTSIVSSFSQQASSSHVTVVSNGNSPPALPVKQRSRAPRLPSQYDNVGDDRSNDLDLEPAWVVSACSSHSGSMHHGSTCTSPTDGTPPPLPLKKRHIMAYMEMFGSASREAWSAVMDPRRTMHVYSAWEKEWMRSQAAFSKENFSLTSTRSCLFASSSTASSSTTVTHWPPLERVDPTTNLNATSPIDPPALPPKLSRTRSTASPPPPLPPIYVAFTPPPVPLPLPPPSPVTPTPSHPPSTPPPQQPIYDFGRELPAPPRPPPMTAQTPTTPSTPLAEPPSRQSTVPTLTTEEEGEEEEEEGPSPLDDMDVTQYLVFKKPEEEGPDIRGGHPDGLIVQATKANKNDFLYQEAFLTTYRTFLSPLELTKKLQRRYERFAYPATDHVRQRAARNSFSLLVRVVSDLTMSDLEDELLRVLMDLIFHLLCCGDLNLARALRVKVLEKCEAKRSHNMTHNALLTSLSIHTRQATLLDFKSEQVAEQMTLLDAELFMKIEIPEVLIWAQEQNEERSPNLTRFTEHFNKMSYWARSRILQQNDAKDRERYVVKFIKVMRHLRRANNFNSYLALLSALDSAPIRRLEWHRQITEGLKEYCALIDSSSSFRAYRQALGETQPPCIPYIGLVLQDLTFVHIGNPDFLPDGNINFSKRWQQFNIVENMKRFKKCQYSFKKQERILALFNNFDDCLCEEAMWQISETIKPRGGGSANKK